MDSPSLLPTLILIIVILFGFSIHEFAHAWVANRLGDPTARLEGRLSLNPLAHWDPIGTTLLVGLLFLRALNYPVFAFGWGKPVPINERQFKNPKVDSLKTAISGPLSNFLLAILLSLLVRFQIFQSDFFFSIIYLSVTINIYLGVFNLIPVPPLDGSTILRAYLPDRSYEEFEQLSPYLIIGLITIILVFPDLFISLVDNLVTLLIPLQ